MMTNAALPSRTEIVGSDDASRRKLDKNPYSPRSRAAAVASLNGGNSATCGRDE